MVMEGRSGGILLDMDKSGVICEVYHDVEEELYLDVDGYLTKLFHCL